MAFFPEGLLTARKKHEFVSVVPRCDLCKYCTTANAPKQKPVGSGRVMFVGEFPDSTADLTRKPLSGTSAGILKACLSRSGMSLSDVVYVNALACRPDTKVGEKDMYTAVGYCRPTVRKAIDELKPEVIIPMGDLAVRSVIAPFRPAGDSMSSARWAGYQIPLADLGAWVCPTFGLGYVTAKTAGSETERRSDVPRLLFDRHVRAALTLPGRPSKTDPQADLVINPSEADVVEWLDDIGSESEEIVAFDYETTGLKPDRKEHTILCSSVCRGGGKTYSFMMTPAVSDALARMLKNRRVGKIASNLMFETRWSMARLKTRVANWRWDTMQAAHVFDARGDDKQEGITSIKFQAFALFGVPPWDDHIKPYLSSGKGGTNGLNRIDEIDRRKLLVYCAIDSRMEYLVAEKQAASIGLSLEDWK